MIGGKRRYYGCFRELTDAIRRRDELIGSDWNEPISGNYAPVKERIAKMYGLNEEDIP